eukprot:TRINITY_DN9025_c0_g1_i1.p1 TRINITY_DN9025_c0_g1~~TRINITY_DN9025_c0_g1_i1.p1  ORF type:complete len:506 (+),score=148.31 TRINITY_DN9025_c0_g1_i1:89-1519(+)
MAIEGGDAPGDYGAAESVVTVRDGCPAGGRAERRRRGRRIAYHWVVAAAVAYVLVDVATHPYAFRASAGSDAPPQGSAPAPVQGDNASSASFLELLQDPKQMCERFHFAPEPFWLAIFKTWVQMLIMGKLSDKEVGDEFPRDLNIPSFLFVLYQCVAASFTVYAIVVHPNLKGYNQRAWAIMYSSGALSVLVAAMRIIVIEPWKGWGDMYVESMYPGLEDSDSDDDSDKDSPGGVGKSAARLAKIRVPRKLAVGCLLAACLLILVPGVTHCVVGSVLCAFPLLPVLPALISFYWLVQVLVLKTGEAAGDTKTDSGSCVNEFFDKLGWPDYLTTTQVVFVITLLLFGIYVAVVRFITEHFATIDWLPHPASFGPFVLLGDCSLYCFAMTLALFASDAIVDWAEEEEMLLQGDTVYRVFLMTVFFQSSAAYAAMFYEGAPYWGIVNTEWHARTWPAYFNCIIEQGEKRLGIANTLGFF